MEARLTANELDQVAGELARGAQPSTIPLLSKLRGVAPVIDTAATGTTTRGRLQEEAKDRLFRVGGAAALARGYLLPSEGETPQERAQLTQQQTQQMQVGEEFAAQSARGERMTSLQDELNTPIRVSGDGFTAFHRRGRDPETDPEAFGFAPSGGFATGPEGTVDRRSRPPSDAQRAEAITKLKAEIARRGGTFDELSALRANLGQPVERVQAAMTEQGRQEELRRASLQDRQEGRAEGQLQRFVSLQGRLQEMAEKDARRVADGEQDDTWLERRNKERVERLRLSYAGLGQRAQALAAEAGFELEPDAPVGPAKPETPAAKKPGGSNMEVLGTLLPLAMKAFAGETDPFTKGPPAPVPGGGPKPLSSEAHADLLMFFRRLREAVDRPRSLRVAKRTVIRSGFAGLSEAEKDRLFDLLETIPAR